MGIRLVKEGKHNRWKLLELASVLLISFVEYFQSTGLENPSISDLNPSTIFIIFRWGKGKYIKKKKTKQQIGGRNKISTCTFSEHWTHSHFRWHIPNLLRQQNFNEVSVSLWQTALGWFGISQNLLLQYLPCASNLIRKFLGGGWCERN